LRKRTSKNWNGKTSAGNKPVYVSVLTGKGYGAIGSIMLYGQGAEAILAGLFMPTVSFHTGGIFHGKIIDNGQPVDDVVIGCEKENQFVIHCHGNPILVQKLAQLFIRNGAQLTPLEEAISAGCDTVLKKEAYLEQLKAVTLEGVKIIQSQISGGLSAIVKRWLDDSVSMEEIKKQCHEILDRSEIARRIIRGVKIVLAGPANSGKSTLLNTLAGSQKAVVSDIAGTTRDWVSTFIHIGPLRAEMIDTAGLGENAIRDNVDNAAQQRTLDLMDQCECVLWIEDSTNTSKTVCSFPTGIPVINVSNKSDLPGNKLQNGKSDALPVSAKNGSGIDTLLNEIQKRLQVCGFDCTLPVVFNDRQNKLLEAIMTSGQKEQLRNSLIQLAG
jgi:tRNA modification GTPase